MIIIGIIFGGIFCYEWRYLQQKKRKRRTFFLVLSSVLFMFLLLEALYYFKEPYTITQVIEMVFEPIEKIFLMGK